jgi:hypothetical protein
MEIPEHASILPPDLVMAYRQARYSVGPPASFELALDRPNAALRELMDERGRTCTAFITAWNPHGQVLPDAENQVRQQSLLDELRARGLPWVAGHGADPIGDWAGEDSVLVLGIGAEDACALGREFAQNAILWAGADAVPRLLLLR